MEYKDIRGVCIERGCGKNFVVLAEDVKFYIEKGLKVPKRCQSCRAKRKRENELRERQQNSPFFGAKKQLEELDI